MTLLALLPAMMTQKSLTNAFVVMVVADRPASLQVLRIIGNLDVQQTDKSEYPEY
jgi:hypothetical protein